MATPTSLPATFVAGNVLTAAQMNDLRGAFRILQVVRATDSTDRSTTSSSYVDGNISVTITPTSATSTLLIVWTASVGLVSVSNSVGYQRITTSAGVALSGANDSLVGASISSGVYIPTTLIGYAAPATTSAVTYKGQIAVSGSGSPTLTLRNSSSNTGQMLALEISA